MPPLCHQGSPITSILAHLPPVPQDETAEQSPNLFEKVDALSLGMEAMLVNFNGLFQKVLAIRKGIEAIDKKIQEPNSSDQQNEKNSDNSVISKAFDSNDIQRQRDHKKMRQLTSSGINRMPIDVSTRLSVPLLLKNRWNAHQADMIHEDGLPEIEFERDISHDTSSSPSRAGKGPKKVIWDSRWQDLFDSNDAEARDENPEMFQNCSMELLRRQTFHQHLRINGLGMIHPFSRFRVSWDFVGLLMIAYDAVSIPVYTAWDIDFGDIGLALLIGVICFWSIDIVLGFCTGYFVEATLITSRKAVALHYLRTWLLVDLFLVGLDLAMVALPGVSEAGGSAFRSMRAVRILRLARGLRLLKMSKLALTAEEFFQTIGGNAFVLTLSVVKTLGGIYFLAHLASCSWYFIGQTRYDVGPCWFRLVDEFKRETIVKQYIHSCYWVLGHLCAAPVDSTIYPTNSLERAYTLCLIVSSLLVIGISISKMSNTVSALNRVNAEANDTKRKLQTYLHSNGVPFKLAVRVIRHALEVHKKKTDMALDPFVVGLLSSALVSDINAWQRGKYMQQHPFFVLINDCHPDVILEIYNACVPAVYADSDIVYKIGALSEVLYITVGGTYVLHHFPDLSDNAIVTRFETTEFLCEVSLFAQTYHRSTLKAMTFADSLSIHGADIVQCIRFVPGCVGTIYRYARRYLRSVVIVEPQSVYAEQLQFSGQQIPVRDIMPMELALEACADARGANLPDITELANPRVEGDVVKNTIADIMQQDLSTAQIIQRLEFAFPEIQEEDGIYTQLLEPQERQRSVGAMLGLLLLTKNSYTSFIKAQREDGRMTRELWDEWQLFVAWADLSQEIVHALLVFLAIRGLGKIKTVQKLSPLNWRSPEDAILHLMESALDVVPSASHLSDTMYSLVQAVLQTHKKFNLAQLMQGENTPAQVLALKRCIQAQGEVLLKFYLCALVGMMCGLKGHVTVEGCLFMDEKNARNVLSCIQCLRQIRMSQPHAVYWDYLLNRGSLLGLQTNSPEQITIVRLACLLRASNNSECFSLQNAWAMLDPYDKQILVQHFLADGIYERAFLLSFLPVYLVNAEKNCNVGLHRGLLVLIDLLTRLENDGTITRLSDTMIVVNLSDVARFTNEVINSLAFESLAEHSNITCVNSELRVTVLTKHWQASSHDPTWRPDLTHEIAHVVKRMSRMTRGVGQAVW